MLCSVVVMLMSFYPSFFLQLCLIEAELWASAVWNHWTIFLGFNILTHTISPGYRVPRETRAIKEILSMVTVFRPKTGLVSRLPHPTEKPSWVHQVGPTHFTALKCHADSPYLGPPGTPGEPGVVGPKGDKGLEGKRGKKVRFGICVIWRACCMRFVARCLFCLKAECRRELWRTVLRRIEGIFFQGKFRNNLDVFTRQKNPLTSAHIFICIIYWIINGWIGFSIK